MAMNVNEMDKPMKRTYIHSGSTFKSNSQRSTLDATRLPPIPKIYCNGAAGKPAANITLTGEVQEHASWRSPPLPLLNHDTTAKSNSLPELSSAATNTQLVQPHRDLGSDCIMEPADDASAYAISPLAAKAREDRLSVYCSPRITRRARVDNTAWVRSRKDQFNWLNAFDPKRSQSKMDKTGVLNDGDVDVTEADHQLRLEANKQDFEKLQVSGKAAGATLDLPQESDMSRSYNDLLDRAEIEHGPVTVRVRRPSILTTDEHLSKSCSHLAEFDGTNSSGIRDVKCPSQLSLMSPSSPLSSRISLYSDGTRSYEDLYDEAYRASFGNPEKPLRLNLVREWLYYHTDNAESPQSNSPGTP